MADDFGFQPIESPQDDLGFQPMPKMPDMSGVQKRAQENLAANDNKEKPEDGTVVQEPPIQRVNTAAGFPVDKVINGTATPSDFNAQHRAAYIKATDNGSAASSSDWIHSSIYTIAPIAGGAAYAPFKPLVENTLSNTQEFNEMLGKETAKALLEPYPKNVPYGLQTADVAMRTLGKAGNVVGDVFGTMISPLIGFAQAGLEPSIPAEARAIGELIGVKNPNLSPQVIHQLAAGQASDVVNAALVASMTPELRENIFPPPPRSPGEPPIAPEGPIIEGEYASSERKLLAGPKPIWDEYPGSDPIREKVGEKLGKDPSDVTSQEVETVIHEGGKDIFPPPGGFKDVETVTQGTLTAEALQHLWTLTGILPDKVLMDAKTNPEIIPAIQKGEVPEAYRHLVEPQGPHEAYYDFDTDTYGVKRMGEKPITGFERLEDAQAHADEKNGELPSHVTEGPPVDHIDFGKQDVLPTEDVEATLNPKPAEPMYLGADDVVEKMSLAARKDQLAKLREKELTGEIQTHEWPMFLALKEKASADFESAKKIEDYYRSKYKEISPSRYTPEMHGSSVVLSDGKVLTADGALIHEDMARPAYEHAGIPSEAKGEQSYDMLKRTGAVRVSGVSDPKVPLVFDSRNGFTKKQITAIRSIVKNNKRRTLEFWNDGKWVGSTLNDLNKYGRILPPSESGQVTTLHDFLSNNNAEFKGNELVSIKRDGIKLEGESALEHAYDLAQEYGYLPKDEASQPLRPLTEFQDALKEGDGGKKITRLQDADRVAAEKEAALEKRLKGLNRADIEREAFEAGIDITKIKDETNKEFIKRIAKELIKNQEGSMSMSVPKDIRDIISPTMASPSAKKTAMAFRKAYGEAARRRAIDEAELERFAKQAVKLTNNPTELSKLYRYIEGRSKGAVLSDTSLQAMADGIRDVFVRTRTELESMPETRQMRFIQDYFVHQFKNEEAANKFISDFIAAQGSGRNLKKRIVPTIEEALAAGLELKEPNPIRAVSRYIANMNNYIASVNALRAISTELGGKYYSKGLQPEGYEPLVGKNVERIENAKVDEKSGKLIPARTLQLYAPSDVATIYNRFYSKGFEDTKGKTVYELVRGAINANTLMELGLSTYHAGTITIQSLNQDVGRFMKNAAVGDWQGAVNAIQKLVTPAPLPGSHYRQGGKGIEQYKMLRDNGVDLEAMANHFAQANIHLGLDPLSRMAHRGFYQVVQRGELPELMDKLKSQVKQGYGLGLLQSGAEVTGRIVSDVSAPLFNHYIPRIKFDSFADLMGDWLRQHPNASAEEIQFQQSRIGDLIDDRFGELNMENIFWNRMIKQVTGLLVRAPGWDLGLVRQIGGPPLDIYRILHDAATGKKFNPDLLDRPLFLLAGAMVLAALNSLMTYLKTGTPPSKQVLEDFLHYKTGGKYKTLGGYYDERGVIPGHGREVLNLLPIPGQGPLSGLSSEIANKVTSLPKNLWDLWEGTDFHGDLIYDPKSENPLDRIWGVAQAGHVAKGFEPFIVKNFENTQPGSNLSFLERALGVHEAGAKDVAPKELEKYLNKKDKKKSK